MAKKKNFGMKNFFFSLAAVILSFYIFQNINSSVETMVAENGNLEDAIEADGIVVKDETVYTATMGGSVTYYYEDGAKVKAGQLVADLNTVSSTHKVPYYSGQAGLITYNIDGLENEYNIKNVLNMTPSSTVKKDYTLQDKSKCETVVENEEIFKIIRNFDYYIVATVDNEKAKLFEENKYIKTRITADGCQHEVWGYIEKINYGSEQSVLILYFDDYFYKIYDKRYVELELITDIYDGIKISTKALTELNGLTGVYVQDASNIIKFFPVEILGRNEEYAIISTGEYVGEHDRRIIKINEKVYPTVKIFDKIILEPENVYDGQIAD